MPNKEYILYFTIYLNKSISTDPWVIRVNQGSGSGLFLCRVIKRFDWLMSIVLVSFDSSLCSLNSVLISLLEYNNNLRLKRTPFC